MTPGRQLPLSAEWAGAFELLARFEARIRALRLLGLTLWTGAVRGVLDRLRAREAVRQRRVEQLLLQLEDLPEVRASARAQRLTAAAKAALGAATALLFAIGLGCAIAASCTGANEIRRPGREGRAPTVRVSIFRSLTGGRRGRGEG